MKARISTGRISFDHLDEAAEQEFFNSLEKFEQKVLNAFKATGVENADEIFNTSLNLGEVLRAIPKNVRSGLLREYQNIVGFRQMSTLLDENTGGAVTEFSTASTGKKLRRFNIDLNQDPGSSGKLNPLAVIYNRATISEDYLTGGPTMGSNIIKSSHLRNLIEKQQVQAGKNIFVFDTETASLGTGNIREIAAFETTTSMVDGRTIVESPTKVAFHKNLKTTQMRLGSLYDERTRAVSTMEETLKKQMGFNFVEGSPQEGAEFAKVVKDFLTRMNNADHIVGQNLQFDIIQIFQGIKNTNAYKADATLRNIVKQSETKLATQGVVIDTLEIARQKLDINLAPELSLKGAVSTHSLDNILLETNLVDLMIDDIGGSEEELLDLLMGKKAFGGVHGAAVDTRIETYLFKYLMEDKLVASPESGQRFIDERPAVKRVLQQSYAPTPVTNIANLGHISPKVLDRMAEVGGINVMRDNKLVSIKGVGDYRGLRGDDLRTRLGEETEDVFYRMTPIQQQMLEQRNMGMLEGARSSVVGRASAQRAEGFSNFAQADVKNRGFMNADGTLRIGAEMPSMQAYNTFQQSAAASGDVLAGLSLPERMVTEGMRRASLIDEAIADSLPAVESTGASLIDNLGISYFRATEASYFSKSTGMISLPPTVMQHLESIGVLEGTNFTGVKAEGRQLQSIRVSAFQTNTGQYRAQAAVDVGQANLERVANYFNELTQDEMAALPEQVRRLIGTQKDAKGIGQAALRMLGSDVPKAISIGELTGKAAETAHNVMAPFSNSSQIMSDMTEMTFTSSLIDTNESIVRLSAFTGRDYMTEGEKTLIDDVARQTANQRETVIKGVLEGDYQAEQSASRVRRSMGRVGSEVSDANLARAVQVAEVTKNITSKLPIAAGLVAAAFAGKKIVGSLKERQEVDETFDFQGYETGTDYYNLQQQVQAATIRKQRRLDPLATAGITANMYNARNNHTLMGPNSNAHLFNGVIL